MNGDKTACRTPAEGRNGVTNIPTWKFQLIRGHILNLCRDAGEHGVQFSDLSNQISERLTPDEKAKLGSIGWHSTTVKLELEVRGEIIRKSGVSPQVLVSGGS